MPEQSEQFSINEQQKNKIEKSKEKRSRVYLEIISPANKNDEKLTERQTAVLKELPDIVNLSRFLKASLKAHAIEYPQNGVPDKNIIQGALFEELVKIENSLFNLSTESSTPKQNINKFSDLEKGSVESGLDEQITMLFHNPDRFNYHELSHLRNPDISFVETDIDGKTLKVVGVGEAKSSRKLDSRCLSQFKYFHRNLNKVADFINHKDDCEKHGLKHFGEGSEKTTIVVNEKENFGQYLIVTNDMDIGIDNFRKNFKTIGDGSLSETDATAFEEMIKKGEIKIIKSSFSHQELDLLVNKIEHLIEEDIKLELLEFQAEQESL